MDLLIVGAVLMLALWTVLVLFTAAAGWVHLLLTVGVFLLIWRIVVRGTPSAPSSNSATAPADSTTGKR